MAQVLKQEVKEKIFEAAQEIFYEQNFKRATMQGIAAAADVPVGLIYTYFPNKASLFSAVVAPVSELIAAGDNPPNDLKALDYEYLLNLLSHSRLLVTMADKSQGTPDENMRSQLTDVLEKQLRIVMKNIGKVGHDDFFLHLLACNFTESLLEIARNFVDEAWSRRMLNLVMRAYFEGVNHL